MTDRSHKASQILNPRGTALRALLLYGALLALLAGCASPTPVQATPTAVPTATPPQPFRIVGYTQYGGYAAASVLQFDKLTHINYAFLLPNPDGTFADTGQSQGLDRLAVVGHQRGVKVLISVGGWGLAGQFEQLAATPATRAVFVNGLLAYVDKYNLDGVDLDWEYPQPGASAQNFASLVHELAGPLHAKGKLLTAAVAALGPNADTILAQTFDELDFLNLMVYDGPGQNHSSYEYAEQSLAYWAARGLPAAKRVLGVPFYTRPLEISYRKLAQEDPAAFDNDQAEYNSTQVFYNGASTLRRKTALALQQAGGIMIWRLDDDAFADLSLLQVIYKAAHP